MAVSPSFLELAKEIFAPFGAISIRRMFGGAGIYCDDLFFAIIDDDAIYFKVDDASRNKFEAAGLAPFTFEMKDGSTATMSYYAAPESIFDDPGERRDWTTLALDAARRAARLKQKKTKRGPAKKAPPARKAAKRR